MKEVSNLKERLREQRPASWETLPDIPLYMDQVLSLMSRQTIRFGEEDALTAAMVNNYIKDGVVPRAEGKRYHAEHLAYLTMVCVLKQVLAVKDAALLTGSALIGALLVLLTDTIGRLAFAPLQIPAGIIISLIGCPFFILLLWRRRDAL